MNGNRYQCDVINRVGTNIFPTQSNIVTLTVGPPTISNHPADQTVTAGGTATFSVSVTNHTSGQWQRSSNSGSTWNYIPEIAGIQEGVITTTLTLKNVLASMNGEQYRFVANNAGGNVNSNSATLTVNPATPPPTITNPANQTVTEGHTATFSITATNATLYQWQLDYGDGVWHNTINGGVYNGSTHNNVTTATMTVTNTQTAANGHRYRCIATNAAGSATSNPATLTVNAATVAVTGVTLNQTSLTRTVGDASVTLTATVAPANATNKNVSWSTSNPGVAAVNNGTVSFIAAGTATITVTTQDGNRTATCNVTVNAVTTPPVPVTSIAVAAAGNATAITANGGTLQMSATVLPANATNRNVTWSLAGGAGYASISATGLLTAEANGTATVRATAADGSGVYGERTITISGQTAQPPDPVTYTVSIAPTTGGSVATNKDEAEPGETVTLTITPDANYVLESIAATRLNNANITVPLSGSGNTRTFVMPAYDVHVAAVFRDTRVDVETLHATSLRAYVQGGTLYISGVSEGTVLRVYNVLGILVYQGIAKSNKAEITLPGRGVYIVTDGSSVIKIAN
jgi:uncharacterized protein YjdB